MSIIYIFRIGNFGDTLMAIPAIKKISEIHRDKDLILITNKPAKGYYVTAWDTLKYTGYFKDVFFYDGKGLKGLLKLSSQIKNGGKSVLYYLPPERTKKQAIRDYIFFKFICRIDKIFGLKESIGDYIVRDKKGNLIKVERESDRLLKIVNRLYNIKSSASEIQFPLLSPPKSAYEKVMFLLKDISLENKVLIAIGHGSKMPAKRWKLEKYLLLCNKLLDYNERIIIILIGGKEDAKIGEYLKKILGSRVINFEGKTNIIESAALLERCKLYIGNDSGPLHLAASMGIPIIGIFSARDNPGKWDPLGENNIILRKDVDCAGCFLEECIKEKNKCLEMIDVEEVFKSVISQLEKKI